jgi:hypothetical protein
MRQFRHIGTRQLALGLGLMIVSLMLVPPGSFAQTDESEANAQTQPALTPPPFERCYQLKFGRWWPWGFGEENAYVTPPRRIQLLGERGTRGFEQDKLLIRTVPHQDRPPGSRESSFWNTKSPNRVLLTWTDGFVGVTLDLAKSKDELKGWAHPHFDAPHFVPRIAHVTAQPIECEADTGASSGGEHPHNPTDQQRQSPIVARPDWQKVDAGPFSILAPPGWKFHQLTGVDSYVGEFTSDTFVLKFEFGDYSNPLKVEKKPAYVVTHKSIGGRRAKVVSPTTPGHGITGVYIRNVVDSNALTLWGKDLTPEQQELALKIFETLRFGGPPPKYVLPPPASKNVK